MVSRVARWGYVTQLTLPLEQIELHDFRLNQMGETDE